MERLKRSKGFTLIELLLVVVIIGLMLAVIVPRAWRANIDTKYGLVRQNASELSSFAQEWAEKGILAQDEVQSTAMLVNYFCTLAATGGGNSNKPGIGSPKIGAWVASTGTSNWNNGPTNVIGTNPIAVSGRYMNGVNNQPPEDTVEDVTPPDKIPRNPFNGVSVYESPNFPTATPVTGALACGAFGESATGAIGFVYFAFVFQGTDSTSTDISQLAAFHAGQETQNLGGLRNGIFLARLR